MLSGKILSIFFCLGHFRGESYICGDSFETCVGTFVIQKQLSCLSVIDKCNYMYVIVAYTTEDPLCPLPYGIGEIFYFRIIIAK